MTLNRMESTLAGSWYDADPGRLKRKLDEYLRQADVEANPSIFAVVVPHAGYDYSGSCAAFGAKALAANPRLHRVVVLGFTHRIHLPNVASVPMCESAYCSPLGETAIDAKAIAALARNPLFADVPASRRGENSVEMALPLLQAALAGREWTLVPVTLGQLDDRARMGVADALRPLLDDQTALVVSSDFTHYGPQFGFVPFRRDVEANLRKLDGGAIQAILTGDGPGFDSYCAITGATICGQDPIGVLTRLLPPRFDARELAYDTSGRIVGDFEHSVSYASLAFYRKESP